ncbi:sigma-54 interaction domain-containing protein [Halomonas piscis]|uniref:sigma-54 interaction domain-containing protein n=1 Tax=Halomonas piscis TaxID=3031727 RepID=UPI00289DA397|nr:sigma-54 dependent transcriptional regulator [Halomonas piscis]
MERDQRCWLVAEAPEKLGSLVARLEALGWTVTRPKAPFTSRCLEDDEACLVGLVQLDGMTGDPLRQLESLLLHSRCLWFAILPDDALEDAARRSLVATLCHGFIEPGVDGAELGYLMRRAAALVQLQRQELALHRRTAPLSADIAEYEMVGTAPAMRTLFQTIRKVAAVDAPVLINGESGTGKELTAVAIHERSPRVSGVFHAINCGALPDQLIQSELFGHEKGAFTGAAQRKIGRIEAADAGTLFLDEIGDLPLEQQVNLLRFLETRRIQRVGGLSEIAVDVRILAATHVNLEEAVREGRFREDLYHRLNVLQVKVPALRDHPEDIEILARYFFERFIREKPGRLKGFSRDALQAMRDYSWPGNIRELINRVRRAMVMCDNRLIQPEDLGIERRQGPASGLSLCQARDEAERDALVAALQRNAHRVQAAARELDVSRVTIYRLMEKHGLARPMSEAPV